MAFNSKSVIVTGASGFIGTHLVNRLLELDFSVIAVTRRVNKKDQNKRNDLFWVEWSGVTEFLKKNKSGPVAIIHLATAYGRNGESLASVEEANVMLPLQLLGLAVQFNIKKFITTDSYFGKPEFNYQYMRPYIITKTNFNAWGRFMATQEDLQFINMRLEHVYGPGDGQGKFIPYIVDSLMAKKQIIECTSCTQKRDFIYVDDVVSAFITVLSASLSSNYIEYEVGTGTSISVKEFIEIIKGNIPTSDSIFNFGSIPQRENEIMDSKANNKELKSIGWSPKNDTENGVRHLLAFHRC
ncbi:NAD-dependent epimerase/dehydratase family protein [Plesiomonas shigelloides]|uniref:NAD-dependent epimerase/dehydratase family protein n=1 Tax=Plesiomonas shigelloides TaxID=703 RepID=UPI0030C42F98